jgi:hypothetical protein
VWHAIEVLRRKTPYPRLAALAAAAALLALTALVLPAAAAKAAPSQPASPAGAGCKGVTLAVIPAQGVISTPGQTEGGHLWWQNTAAGICVGTVIEDLQFIAAPPTVPLWLRVIVFDTSDPTGVTVGKIQVTADSGPLSRAFGIHQAFPGLSQVCLAANSEVLGPQGMPCVQIGQPAPVPQQQFTQSAAVTQAPGVLPPWFLLPSGQSPWSWWP